MQLREVTMLAIVLRIVLSVLIGGLIGLERELKNRPAGLRTYMVVSLGACLIMLTNQYIYQAVGTGDPVRMGAQVVSGIGFLGAGTIMVTRRNQIKGLTTAAGLWTAAGVGLAIGVGFYEAAIIGGVAVYLIMTLMQIIDKNVQRKNKSLELYVELAKQMPLGDLLRELQAREIEIRDIQHELNSATEDGVRGYIVYLKQKKRQSHLELLDDLQSIPGVVFLEKL
ncbi:MAG: MgtC/SapB family protein [Oscillospiraceae bacterium]|nr:MgtC/SapB family protein [Oscillospiraceae bacterium]